MHRTWVRIVLAVALMHAVLVPALYVGIAGIVDASAHESFANHARSAARLVADELERVAPARLGTDTAPILDGAILGGRCVYAALVVGDRLQRSPLSTTALPALEEDFEFGDHGDDTYFVFAPVQLADGSMGVLRIGFDEAPTRAEIQAARRQLAAVLALYTAISLLAAGAFGWWLIRPLQTLQRAAARIAAGDRSVELRTASSLAEVRSLAQQLESMRTQLVASAARLAESQRLETIGTLAGGMAHEFNNILTPILLYAQEALVELPADAPIREDLEQVVRGAQRARRLVGQVLTFSRGGQASPAVVFDARSVVAEVDEFLRKLVPPSVVLQSEMPDTPLPVRGDPALLHQLLVNLCINGYQSMRARGGELRVMARAVTEIGSERLVAGDYVLLGVRDQGHGIDAEHLGRIFEPFFTTREIGEGTGLGLSVVHGIARSMGGTVLVDSQRDVGSHFRVYIPLAAEHVASTPSA